MRHFQFLAILLLVGVAFALEITLPSDAKWKTENGITITTSDWNNQIFRDYTLHYYIMEFDKMDIPFSMAKTDLTSLTEIKDVSLYPVSSVKDADTVDYYQEAYDCWQVKDDEACKYVNITDEILPCPTHEKCNYRTRSIVRQYVKYISNEKTKTTSMGQTAYILEVKTSNFEKGSWNGLFGGKGIDPDFNSCGNFTTADTVYTAIANIYHYDQTCINITANNVTLDCAGFSVVGGNASNTFGVYVSGNNVTIANCNISNFSTGIWWNKAGDGGIFNTTVNNSFRMTSTVGTTPGMAIATLSTNNLLIENTTAQSDGGAAFTAVTGANFTRITDSAFVSNMSHGIYIGASHNISVNNTVAAANDNTSIYVLNSYSNNITNTNATSNGSIALYIDASYYSYLFNDFLTSNASYGLYAGGSNNTGDYIYANSSKSASIRFGGSYNNYSNLFCNSTAFYSMNIDTASNHTFINLTARRFTYPGASGAYGIYTGSMRNNNFTNVFSQTVGTTAGIYLDANNQFNNFDNVTTVTDLGNGFSISGGGSIKNNFTNITTYGNGTGAGLRIDTSYNRIDGMYAVTNSTAAYNFYLTSGSHNNTLSNILGIMNGTGFNGVSLFLISSSQNNITNATTYANNTQGLLMQSASGNIFTNGNFTSRTSVGMQARALSNDNIFTNCSFEINTSTALQVMTGSTNNTFIGGQVVTRGSATAGTIMLISGGSNFTTFNGTTFKAENGSQGISILNSTGTTIDCTGAPALEGRNYTGSLVTGITSNGNKTQILNCQIHNYTNAILFTQANHSLIQNVTVSSTSYSAIMLNDTQNTSVIGSTANATNKNVAALRLSNSSNCTIANNTLVQNRTVAYALLVNLSSIQNNFTNNTLLSSTLSGWLLSVSSDSWGNAFQWNNFTATSGLYVNDTNGSNHYNLTEGNIWPDIFNGTAAVTGTAASSFNPSWFIGSAGAGYPYSNNTSQYVSSGVVDNAPLTPNGAGGIPYLNCSSELNSANTIYNMTQNAFINGTNCFNITANNVTLDCKNKWIIGNNSSATYGVYSAQPNTTVANCIISNFSDGIRFNTASYGLIENVSIEQTYPAITTTSGSAIFLLTSHNNTIRNVVGINTIAGRGLFLYASSNNNVTNAAFSTNTNASFYINQASNYNLFNGINGSSNTSNGIYFNINANNTLINSRGTANTSAGIRFAQNHNCTINNSVGQSNTNYGIDVSSSNYAVLNNATGIGNTSKGLYVAAAHYGNYSASNFVANWSSAVHLLQSRGCIINNSIANNTVGNHVGYGIYLVNNNNDTQIINTTIYSNNSSAIFNDGGANMTVNCMGKTIWGINAPDTYGVYSDSWNTTVVNCTFANFTNAIQLNNSNYSSIINNTLIGSGDLLFITEPSHDNLVFWNNFTNTGGFYVNDTNKSNFYNSSTEGNVWYNVMDLTVPITGTVLSSGYPTLYIGSAGAGYPYTDITSLGKITNGVVDSHPLTASSTAPVIGVLPNIKSAFVWFNVTTGQGINMNVTANGSSGFYNITYEWYLNGVNTTGGGSYLNAVNNTDTNVSNHYGTWKGQNWGCKVRADNSTNYSSWYYCPNATIQNAAPYITSINVYPSSPNASSNLTCNITAIDMDDNMTVRGGWFVNGYNNTNYSFNYSLLINNTLTSVYTINSSNLTLGQNWSCWARVNDSTNFSALNISANVSIASAGGNNTAKPEVLVAYVTNATTGSQIFINITVNGSLSTYNITYEWYLNGVNTTGGGQNSSIANNTLTTLANRYGTWKGQNYSCRIRAYDGLNYSDWKYCPNSTIGNYVPNLTNIFVFPSSPNTSSNLSCNITVTDMDDNMTAQGGWFVNGYNNTNFTFNYSLLLNNTNTLVYTINSSNLTLGQNWSCWVVVNDSLNNSGLRIATNVTIAGSGGNNTAKPQVLIAYTWFNVTTGQGINLNITVNGSIASYSIDYEWYLNGVNTTGGGIASGILNNTQTNISSRLGTWKGQNWSCRIRAYDGLNYSDYKYCPNATIQNAAPYIVNITVYPSSAFNYSNLTCNITAIDMDDNMTAQGGFFVNGYNNTNYSFNYSLVLNNTQTTVFIINSSNLTIGQNWSCWVRVNDSLNRSALNISANVTIGDASLCSGGMQLQSSMTPSNTTIYATELNVLFNGSVTGGAGCFVNYTCYLDYANNSTYMVVSTTDVSATSLLFQNIEYQDDANNVPMPYHMHCTAYYVGGSTSTETRNYYFTTKDRAGGNNFVFVGLLFVAFWVIIIYAVYVSVNKGKKKEDKPLLGGLNEKK